MPHNTMSPRVVIVSVMVVINVSRWSPEVNNAVSDDWKHVRIIMETCLLWCCVTIRSDMLCVRESFADVRINL